MNDVQLIEINIPDWNLFRSFWDFTPSWQNSIEALERKQNRLTIIGLENKDGIIGYGIIEKHTGDIPQIAVHKAFRRKNFGTILLHKLLELSRSNQLRVINADASNASFKSFYEEYQFTTHHRSIRNAVEFIAFSLKLYLRRKKAGIVAPGCGIIPNYKMIHNSYKLKNRRLNK